MNALDDWLTESDARRCEQCRHARASAAGGLYCHRTAAPPYPCQLERASSTIEAWLYGACGRGGRFFEGSALPWASIPVHAPDRDSMHERVSL